MNTCVKESTSSDRDVLYQVTVEGELEAEADGCGPPVGLGQHAVLLHLPRVPPRHVLVVQVGKVWRAVFLELVYVVLVCVLSFKNIYYLFLLRKK